ncbi:MAG: putative MATE family efflux protein [Candidatus Endobugula sp.]|jgi:putative MATE family efflux protein
MKPAAKFTQGSIAKHLLLMTASGTTGLMVLFLSDLVDMYFLGLLGEVEIAAAVGFSGSILFFTVSFNIGLSIACSALVSKAIGSGDHCAAKASVTYSWLSAVVVTLPVAIILWFYIPTLLGLLGAEGRALELASEYMLIIVPSMPLLALAMSAGGVMRARGDAKNAMYLTMLGGIVNVILDPIFIFVLDLGVQGAALATVISRVLMVAFGVYIVAYKNNLLGAFVFSRYREQVSSYMKVAVPAVLTNLSTPIGLAYVTYVMAQFGDSAVAGNAIISRVQPVAFAGLFALSSIVGPIAGQNFGAKKLNRVYETLRESIRLLIIYCFIVCALLFLMKPFLVAVFNASEEANELIYLFCNGISLMFVFNGLTFVTNALFNNLGVAHYATILNFFKATIGTVPFVAVGVYFGGAKGALWGLFAGSVISGCLGLLVAIWFLRKLERKFGLAIGQTDSVDQ